MAELPESMLRCVDFDTEPEAYEHAKYVEMVPVDEEDDVW